MKNSPAENNQGFSCSTIIFTLSSFTAIYFNINSKNYENS